MFGEVRTNVIKTAPARWKLDDLQKGCSQEKMEGIMEREERKEKEEIMNSQIEEKATT